MAKIVIVIEGENVAVKQQEKMPIGYADVLANELASARGNIKALEATLDESRKETEDTRKLLDWEREANEKLSAYINTGAGQAETRMHAAQNRLVAAKYALWLRGGSKSNSELDNLYQTMSADELARFSHENN